MSEPSKIERWRKRAEELRAIAASVTDRTARSSLLEAAKKWERMAEQAQKSKKQD